MSNVNDGLTNKPPNHANKFNKNYTNIEWMKMKQHQLKKTSPYCDYNILAM